MHFKGEFHNSIDAKGRVSIPAAFREMLFSVYEGEVLKVAKNVAGPGLRAYPLKVWARIEETFQTLSPGSQRESMMRSLISPAIDCTFDSQGRIQLSQSLRVYAALEKDVVIVGMHDKIEIWSQGRHAERSAQDAAELKQSLQNAYEIGF